MRALIQSNLRRQNSHKKSRQQYGLTLVELLVAMVISAFIAIAAMSALTVSETGFKTVDAASQLRDNGKFAADLIQRIAAQSGYLEISGAANAKSTTSANVDVPPPYVSGFNNAVWLSNSTPPTTSDALNGNRASSATDCSPTTDPTACTNGSDILIFRYQTPETFPDSTLPDKTVINCRGVAQNAPSINRNDLAISMFHVKVSNGEPSLMCSAQDTTGAWQEAQPLIQGVESLQVLYGVDGMTTANTTATVAIDSVADRYWRADQLTVPSNASATDSNWRRVRSMRIGMVLRSATNVTRDIATAASTYYPLGLAMSAATDVGTIFTPNNDGRLRQVVTFTVYLRNYQGL